MPDADGSDPDVEDVRSALGERAVPLRSVDPAPPLADLDPLVAAIGDADVIGMGEASHGTRDFFRFKHRLFRRLVEDRGLRLLGVEANFAAVLDVDAYVVDGEGSAEAALGQESIHEPYRSESVVDLLEWARSFNEGRPRGDRIRLHGIDMQDASVAAVKLERYLDTVGVSVPAAAREGLRTLAGDGIPDLSDDGALESHVDARSRVVTALREVLSDHEGTAVEATSRQEYERARRLVWQLDQGRRQFEAIDQGRADSGANVRIRDSAMAAQVQWLLSHLSADRIALWGHNAHLTRGPFAGGRERHRQGIPSLGRNLDGLSGLEYYALGLLLGGGGVRATYVPDGEPRPYEIEAPPERSVPDVFSRIDEHAFFVDLAELPANSPLSGWLDSKPAHHTIRGGYRQSPVDYVETDLRRQFDGVVFVAESSPAKPGV